MIGGITETKKMNRARILLFAVFIAGLTTLGIELSASRLLGSVFGTSNIVWANIIGLILVYLTVGYFIGGRLADRYPNFVTFYQILAWAAFAAGIVPIIARPVLLNAAFAVEMLDTAVMVGSFLSILILFSVPITLLGTISPFAIRLSIVDTADAGKVSGRIYAISTLGSILGTFLPVLVLIPAMGTSLTFLVFSLTLLTIALFGLAFENTRKALRYGWMPLLLILLSWLVLRGPLKATEGQIFETESSYNYIQVVERGGTRYLLLNEGQGIHSVYDPDEIATHGTWDYFLAAPFFNPSPIGMSDVKRIGIVGLAAGTISKQYTKVFGPIPIDGWEIDPEIIAVGRVYFDMNEPNLNALPFDGRWGLNQSEHNYSVIGIDAYRLPYIPWHLTTQEFFREVHDHLDSDGAVVINVGRTLNDRRLIEAMVGTLQTVFPSLHLIDVPETFNSILIGTVKQTTFQNLVDNFLFLQEQEVDPLLMDVLERAIQNIQPLPSTSIVFTDERAPIEQLTDAIALRFIFEGSLDTLK
jgi:spermidine synthase